jgi:hypothetical protein
VPSTSQNQQAATAIALNDPDKLYPRNRGLLKMSQSQLSDFASTPRTGLPKRKGRRYYGEN